MGIAKKLVGCCRATAVQRSSYMREMRSNYLVSYHVTIDGPGVIVQIDESIMSKHKYNRGRFVPEHWVIGGIDTKRK